MTFTGFGKDGLKFLTALGFHQNREWFLENKTLYESALREPMVALVETTSEQMAEAGVPLHGTRKASLFRINRDIRFSKEKHPYKTNLGAVLTRTGTKKDIGGVYMHIEPNNCFLASGMWFPPNPELKAMRTQIVERKDEFFSILDDLEKAKMPIGVEGGAGMLSRPPQGFKDVDDEKLMFWLKHKSFVSQRKIADKRITSPDLVDDIVEFGKTALPLMQFIWRATDPLRQEDGNA